MKVGTRRGFRYPNGCVTSTPGDNTSTVVGEQVVVFEILGPATASIDALTRNHEYQAIPSVRRYVMLAQDRIGATVFERAGEDWVGRVVAGDAVLHMPEIGIEVPLPEFYDGLVLEPDPAGQPAFLVNAAGCVLGWLQRGSGT